MTDLHAFVYAPDVTVENLDIAELGRLLQLVLGCAVNCEDKQGTIIFVDVWIHDLYLYCHCVVHSILTECLVLTEYIQVIMSMEESVQHVVMMAIQEVSNCYCIYFTFYCTVTSQNYLPDKNVCLYFKKLVDMVNFLCFGNSWWQVKKVAYQEETVKCSKNWRCR